LGGNVIVRHRKERHMRVGDLSIADLNATVTKESVEAWLRRAKPGARLVYHYGFLARDRCWRAKGQTWDGARATRNDPEPGVWERVAKVADLADFVEAAARAGKLVLTQRRIGPMYWEYRAKKL
jgi:hypothetical protein